MIEQQLSSFVLLPNIEAFLSFLKMLSLFHTLLPCYKSCSWGSSQSRVKGNPLVEMPHLNITSLLLSLLIGEVAEPLAGHPQQVDQLRVMGVGHEHFHKALHKPCAMLVVP